MRDRVKAINQVHGFLLEFGIGLPKGPAIIRRLPSVLAEPIRRELSSWCGASLQHDAGEI
jgi:hypothetical protein